MRVRLDSRGRPRPAAAPPPPTLVPSPPIPTAATAATAANPAPPPTDPDPSASPDPPPCIPVAPPLASPPSPPSPATPSPPAPLPSPARPCPDPAARPPLPPAAPASSSASASAAAPSATPPAAPADEERASDSGSSLAEAYNSEDEHLPAQPTSASAAARAALCPDISAASRPPHERERVFAAQLHAQGLRIVDTRPDGNCLFRALAHILWGDEDLHAPLRAKLIDYLVQERDYFSQFVAEDFARYVRRKRRDGTHGNHLELQAAAELFGKPIEVYSYGTTPATIIDSWGNAANRSTRPPDPLMLSFHRGNHYNAVEPVCAAGGEKRAAQAKRDADMRWRAAVDARATQDEMERAVLALSLVEASRGESAAGSSASSSAAMLPSTVLALIHSGYTEERAKEAYRVAGHGGLAEMVRYLTTDFFSPKSHAQHSIVQNNARLGPRASISGLAGSARPSQSAWSASEQASSSEAEQRPEASLAIGTGPESQAVHAEGSGSSKPGSSTE